MKESKNGYFLFMLIAFVGCTKTEEIQPTTPVHAAFTYTRESTKGQRVFQFYNHSSGSTFLWDFGDGTPIISAQNPLHEYEKPGDYTVKLSAHRGSTQMSLATTLIHIEADIVFIKGVSVVKMPLTDARGSRRVPNNTDLYCVLYEPISRRTYSSRYKNTADFAPHKLPYKWTFSPYMSIDCQSPPLDIYMFDLDEQYPDDNLICQMSFDLRDLTAQPSKKVLTSKDQQTVLVLDLDWK